MPLRQGIQRFKNVYPNTMTINVCEKNKYIQKLTQSLRQSLIQFKHTFNPNTQAKYKDKIQAAPAVPNTKNSFTILCISKHLRKRKV